MLLQVGIKNRRGVTKLPAALPEGKVSESSNCEGQHRYFVANDAATDSGKVLIFLVCTACGEGKKIVFEVGPADTVSIKK